MTDDWRDKLRSATQDFQAADDSRRNKEEIEARQAAEKEATYHRVAGELDGFLTDITAQVNAATQILPPQIRSAQVSIENQPGYLSIVRIVFDLISYRGEDPVLTYTINKNGRIDVTGDGPVLRKFHPESFDLIGSQPAEYMGAFANFVFALSPPRTKTDPA